MHSSSVGRSIPISQGYPSFNSHLKNCSVVESTIRALPDSSLSSLSRSTFQHPPSLPNNASVDSDLQQRAYNDSSPQIHSYNHKAFIHSFRTPEPSKRHFSLNSPTSLLPQSASSPENDISFQNWETKDETLYDLLRLTSPPEQVTSHTLPTRSTCSFPFFKDNPRGSSFPTQTSNKKKALYKARDRRIGNSVVNTQCDLDSPVLNFRDSSKNINLPRKTSSQDKALQPSSVANRIFCEENFAKPISRDKSLETQSSTHENSGIVRSSSTKADDSFHLNTSAELDSSAGLNLSNKSLLSAQINQSKYLGTSSQAIVTQDIVERTSEVEEEQSSNSYKNSERKERPPLFNNNSFAVGDLYGSPKETVTNISSLHSPTRSRISRAKAFAKNTTNIQVIKKKNEQYIAHFPEHKERLDFLWQHKASPAFANCALVSNDRFSLSELHMDSSEILARTLKKSSKNNCFGPFILGRTIGRGEFGKVKLGWPLPGSSPFKKHPAPQVVIKIIRVVKGGRLLRKVIREATILREVDDHPNIVKYVDLIRTKHHMGIVLDYVSGGELFDYILASRRLEDEMACKLFAQLISGVGYLHSKGVVHRDLKLENILLDSKKNIIIADFGFATTFGQFGSQNNQVSTAKPDLFRTSCGSPCYAAPELVNCKTGSYAGTQADIWSCGVILYAMLAGYLPFDDDPHNPNGENVVRLYKYICSTSLIFPEYINDKPRDLLRKILVPDPSRRLSMFGIMRHPYLRAHRQLFERYNDFGTLQCPVGDVLAQKSEISVSSSSTVSTFSSVDIPSRDVNVQQMTALHGSLELKQPTKKPLISDGVHASVIVCPKDNSKTRLVSLLRKPNQFPKMFDNEPLLKTDSKPRGHEKRFSIATVDYSRQRTALVPLEMKVTSLVTTSCETRRRSEATNTLRSLLSKPKKKYFGKDFSFLTNFLSLKRRGKDVSHCKKSDLVLETITPLVSTSDASTLKNLHKFEKGHKRHYTFA
ncbi:CAMK/CAMKL/KIN4 protein kinase Ppk1 [Schizosaccharomyces octosporus yFS286]|uniref:CAMK/CAMKL/KIN4 protein kinase Ppk1 n=1 Tax=Schizosaccharomyces octosporus (strain yFS286) TaxID=483514 RepID=S9PYW3_SCHOY|nr:CAMK/CAMKL/KIN4 protein kinase Ppk1 [Schizosaccharomyces octosporus yFS286]EPX72613.1 CAMK/CAMKL/KIN4 protein kinase Ppk1 [Schizosaccharomyces octosporus yFS286]